MQLLFVFTFINVLCYQSTHSTPCKGDACPICTDPATYSDDQIDQTVKCKTEPNTESLTQTARCPEGQPTSHKIFHERMISNPKEYQYYRVCAPIKVCSSHTNTRCTSKLSRDKNNIPPLGFQGFKKISKEVFKSERDSDKILYYYKYKPYVVTGKISTIAKTRNGVKSCDVAVRDEPCATNCVDHKTSLPQSCEEYVVNVDKGEKREKLIRMDISGIMLDEVDKCVYFQCGPAQPSSVSMTQSYADMWGVDENIIFVCLSVASLICLYACCCGIIGVAFGFWIGKYNMNNDGDRVGKPQNIVIDHD